MSSIRSRIQFPGSLTAQYGEMIEMIPIRATDFAGAKLDGVPAVYWIVASHEPVQFDVQARPQLRHISRLHGMDEHGVLYIGETGNVRERLGRVHATLKNGSFNCGWSRIKHPFGYPYWTTKGLCDNIRPSSIFCYWKEASQDTDFRQSEEAYYIYQYRLRFGELPPFQRGLGDDKLNRIGKRASSEGIITFEGWAPHYAPWALL